MRCFIRAREAAALFVLSSLSITAASADSGLLDRQFQVDIAAQAASSAVSELSKQAGVQVVMPGGRLDGVVAGAVRGRMSLRSALSLLLQGASYQFRQTGDNTITVDVADGRK